MNRRPAMLKKLLLGFGVVVVMAGLVVPQAFAAPAGPKLLVTSLTSSSVSLTGSGFTQAKAVQLEASVGNCVGQNQKAVSGGTFKATFRATATCRGETTITATAGAISVTTSVMMSGPTAVTPNSATTPSATKKPAVKPKSTTATPQPGTQKLGVGGVAAPADAIKTTKDSTSALTIKEGGSEGKPKVYDGGGHTVGTISIRADWVTVQNFKIKATGEDGVSSRGNHVTIQNNDIKNVHAGGGDGDLNAMNFFGNNVTIAYNTAINFVGGDAGGSHTDAIQTWNQKANEASSNVVIKGNRFEGPPGEDGGSQHIHQCVIGEGNESTDGGGGGGGVSENWLVADNYCTGDMKFDDIDNVTVTGNTFAGIDKRAVVVTKQSTGFKYYSDNKITGKYSVGIGADVTKGPGPKSLKALPASEDAAKTEDEPEAEEKAAKK